MKLFKILYIPLILCTVITCTLPDDDTSLDFATTQFEAIQIDNNESSYTLNDTLFINVTFQDMTSIDNSNQSIEDILGSDIEIQGVIRINRNTGFDNPQPLILSLQEVVIESGNTEILEENIFINTINEGDLYKARIGIILKEEGDFFIDSNRHLEEFIFEGFSSAGNISITTSIVNALPDNRFYFTVE